MVEAGEVDVLELTTEQRVRLSSYWWSRAEGEMTSWVGFGHVLEDLVAEGSPAGVILQAQRAVADEHAHAVFCRDWATRYGYAAPAMPEPRSIKRRAFSGATEAESRLLRIAMCGLAETTGCFVLQEARPHVTLPALRALSRRHLSDELRHSRVGWGHLSSHAVTARGRALLSEWMPELLRAHRQMWLGGTEVDDDALVPHGYFTANLLERAHDRSLAEVILPGLDFVNIRRPS